MIGIIGSNGFIGQTLLDRLQATGVPGRAYVRKLAPPAVPGAAPDLAGKPQTGVTTVRHSLADRFDPAVFDGIDTLILLASATRPNSPGNTPLTELTLNIAPHLTLFQGLRDTGVRHLIYLSSGGAIYGDRPTAAPIDEDEPCRPCDAYGFGKLAIETALGMIWGAGDGADDGLNRRATIIRPANPVGAHQLGSVGAHGLVTTVLHHLRLGLPVTVQGDGTALRDYFAATDLADLILRVAQQPGTGIPVVNTGPHIVNAGSHILNAGSHILNAGSGTGLSILQVIDHCAAHLGVRADIRFNPGLRPAVRCNVLQTRRAADLFGWQPKLDLPAILAELTTALELRGQMTG